METKLIWSQGKVNNNCNFKVFASEVPRGGTKTAKKWPIFKIQEMNIHDKK
jgi:hypothetical protein